MFFFLFIQTWQREAKTRTWTSYVIVGTSKYTRGQVEKKRGGGGFGRLIVGLLALFTYMYRYRYEYIRM